MKKLLLMLVVISSTTLFANSNEKNEKVKKSEFYSYCWE